VSSLPQIDTAQPETRPEVPNPGQPDTGCRPKCGWSHSDLRLHRHTL